MTTTTSIGLCGIDALYFELGQMQDDLRKVSRDARRDAQGEQVEALYEKAEHIEQAALWEGLGTIAKGAGQAGSGALGIGGGPAGLSQQTIEASQQMTSGSGEATDGLFGIVAGQERADETRCDARAAAAQTAADDAREIEQDARGTQDQLLRSAETTQSLQQEARTALLRA